MPTNPNNYATPTPARHSVADERPPPSAPRRQRRRGPRSPVATAKRCNRTCPRVPRGQPQDSGLCQSRPELSINTSITLLHLNIRCFVSHQAELTAHIHHHNHPSFIAITETWLDDSTASPKLPGYTLTARLDRRDGRQRGGIALFSRDDAAVFVVHILDSARHERLWCLFHSCQGPLLMCLWYRPPCYGEIDSVQTLKEEWLQLKHLAAGAIIVGDMNVHQKSWLAFSRTNSPEGNALEQFCKANGFIQKVQSPTRDK